jgi:hypothetical protein
MMGLTDTWRHQARTVIATIMASARVRGVSLHETIALIDAAYPFGPRKYWPYQQWLRERRVAIARLTLWHENTKRGEPRVLVG